MRAKRKARFFRRVKLWLVTTALLLAAGLAQTGSNAAASATTISGEQIISFLNQTIVWSRQVSAEQQLVSEPSDTLFLNDSRQTSEQVVRLAFEFARAQAQTSQAGTGATAVQSAASQYQRLVDSVNQADQKVKSLQQELEGFRQQLLTATGRKRTTVQALISETEGKQALYQTRRD